MSQFLLQGDMSRMMSTNVSFSAPNLRCARNPFFVSSQVGSRNQPPQKNIWWSSHLRVGAANSKLAPDRTVLTETKLYPGSHFGDTNFWGSKKTWLAMENGTNLKEFFLYWKMGDFPASHVSCPWRLPKIWGFQELFLLHQKSKEGS